MAFSAAVAKAARVELLRLDLVDDLGDEIVAQSTVAIGIWNFSDVTVEQDSVLVVNSLPLYRRALTAADLAVAAESSRRCS